MSKRSSLYLVLLFFSVIPLSGICQVSDTTKCYGLTELRKIAIKLTKCQESDTLLVITTKQLDNRNQTILLNEKQIQSLYLISDQKDKIIEGKNQDISNLTLTLSDTQKSLKFTKLKWLGTTLVLSVGLIYFIVN